VAHNNITERKRAEEALRRQAEELDALQATVLDITARHDLPALLETIVQRAAHLLGAPGGGLYLCGPERKELRCVVSYNAPRDYTGVVLSYGEGAAGVVAETGEPLIVDDYRVWDKRAAAYEEDQPFGAVLSAPMTWKGEVTGVIHVLHEAETGRFTRSDLELLNLFANHAAIAVANARLYDRLRKGHERLQVLSQRIVDAQEMERRRIARELHDEIGQALTAVKIDLQAARGLLDDFEHEAQLTHTVGVVEHILQQIRDLSLDLRPSLLDDLGLVPALRWYVDRQAQQMGVTARFRADFLENRLAPELEIACFRIVQEALTNVTRHAHAERVGVELRKSDEAVEVRIRDDGVGFDVQRALDDTARGKSLGLLSLRERASVAGGEVEIESAPEVGTEVRARFPLVLVSPDEP
jgi:signal transduction histidine kinase